MQRFANVDCQRLSAMLFGHPISAIVDKLKRTSAFFDALFMWGARGGRAEADVGGAPRCRHVEVSSYTGERDQRISVNEFWEGARAAVRRRADLCHKYILYLYLYLPRPA